MEFTLLAAAATGVGAMWAAARLAGDRITVVRPGDVLLSAAMTGLLTGRIAAMVQAGVNPVTSPGDLIVVRGGVDTVWASVGAGVALLWTARRRLPEATDQLAPLALVGLGGWHGGCVWRGACLGTTTDLPWAFTTPGSAVGRHPVELYTAVLLVAAAWLATRARRPWQATGWAVAAAGAARLVTQPLRLSITGGPVWWYVSAVVVGVAVSVLGARAAVRD